MTTQDFEPKKVTRDGNGNPRYAVHFLTFITDNDSGTLDQRYTLALKRAKALGGKKFHNKQFGGGIVFQSYNVTRLKEEIVELVNSL